MSFSVRVAVLVIGLVASACGGGAGDGGGALGRFEGSAPPVAISIAPASTLPLAEQALDDPEVTTVATDLAPSQIAGSTMPEPATPGPCALDDIELWTARVTVSGSTVDAVLRVRNVGDVWCEPDIGRSPRLDPAVEPDVWLLPGGLADLYVGQMVADCDTPSLVSGVQVGIGDESTVVPSALVTCGWWLNAFVPLDDPFAGCDPDQLDVAVARSTIVIRNSSSSACGLSGPVEATGVDTVDRDDRAPQVRDLFPGDVVALSRLIDSDCDGGPSDIVIVDELVGEISVTDVPCNVAVALGAPRPWFGASDGPIAALTPETLELAAALEALDPFAAGE